MPDMPAMYAIDVDVDRRVVWITTWGFWSLKTITAFSLEIMARGTAARVRYGQFAVFADLRAAPVQTTEVADGTAGLLTKALKLTSAPIVSVAGSMLGKYQSERVLAAPNSRVFIDMDEARAWLESQWPSARGGTCPPVGTADKAA